MNHHPFLDVIDSPNHPFMGFSRSQKPKTIRIKPPFPPSIDGMPPPNHPSPFGPGHRLRHRQLPQDDAAGEISQAQWGVPKGFASGLLQKDFP